MSISQGQLWEVVDTYNGRPPDLSIGDRFLIESLPKINSNKPCYQIFFPINRFGKKIYIRLDDLYKYCKLLGR